MEVRNLERCVAIKFYVKLGDLTMETYGKILVVYSGDSLNCAQAFHRHKEFERGCESVKDKVQSGRQVEVRTDTKVQCVRNLIH